MGKIKDLTGQKFNRLLVLEDSGQRKNRQVVWKCLCDCGNITYVVGQALRDNHTKSCGCLQKEKAREAQMIFLKKGQQFGNLTVVQLVGKNKFRNNIWECECICGKHIYVQTKDLISGEKQSCGCDKSPMSKGENKIVNFLDLHDIPYFQHYAFEDLKSPKNALLFFDFVILNEDGEIIKALEYDGKQHYFPNEFFGGIEAFNYLQQCDIIKNNYCQKNQIQLLRIKYNENIEEKLNDFILQGSDKTISNA